MDSADPDPVGGTAWNRSDTDSRCSASVAPSRRGRTFRLANSTALFSQILKKNLIHLNSQIFPLNGPFI